jgi:catalase (peroxidase I)
MMSFHRVFAMSETSRFDREIVSRVEEEQTKLANKKLRFHLNTMKHSKKESRPEGHSKGENNDKVLRTGPIMIEDIVQDGPSHHKKDMAIRDLNMRTDPTNDQSPVISRRFKPLDNPRTILESFSKAFRLS